LRFSDATPHDVLLAAAVEHVNAKPSADIKTVDDLSFRSRDKIGRICWFDVIPPQTDYWPFHHYVGRAYVHQLLELIENVGEAEAPEPGEGLSNHTFGFIANEIVRNWRYPMKGVYEGFFSVISDVIHQATITVDKRDKTA
jgi:hypothetical protein